MKKLLLISIIILSTTPIFAADKWTGPTSPIDPMWGMSGSSIMAEALRNNQPSLQQQMQMQDKDRKIGELQEEINTMRSKGKSSSSKYDWLR